MLDRLTIHFATTEGEPDGDVLGVRDGGTEGTTVGTIIGAWEGLLVMLGLSVEYVLGLGEDGGNEGRLDDNSDGADEGV